MSQYHQSFRIRSYILGLSYVGMFTLYPQALNSNGVLQT